MAKYRKGELYKSIGEATRDIAGGKFIYFNDKIYHSGWASNWSINFLKTWIREKRVNKAVKNGNP